MLHALFARAAMFAQENTAAPGTVAVSSATSSPQPPAEPLFGLGPIPGLGVVPVTNTVFTAWIVIIVLLLFAYFSTRNLKDEPTGLQNFWELIVETWINIVERSIGPKGRRFVPLIGTLFLYIIFSNWLGILPGVGDITAIPAASINSAGDRIPVFRSANSDLNLTAAMAIAVIVVAEVSEFISLGFLGYLRGLLIPNPMRWLEIFTRPLSLSFRLFGNIFAGEVLVVTMLAIAPYTVFVFLALELFVGFIQALVFAMLSMTYIALATVHDREHGEHHGFAGDVVAEGEALESLGQAT